MRDAGEPGTVFDVVFHDCHDGVPTLFTPVCHYFESRDEANAVLRKCQGAKKAIVREVRMSV